VLSQPQASANEEIPEQINQLLRTRQYSAALQQLETLARDNHVGALKQLASLYRSGRGVPRDRDKALQFLTRAAELGDTVSQFYLGKLLVDDARSGTERDTGLDWLKKAAAQGHPEAQRLYQEAFARTQPATPGIKEADPVPAGSPGEYIVGLAERGDTEILQKALASGVSVDIRDRHGRTPLSASVQADRLQAAALLLRKGADPNVHLAGNNTPLLLATKARRADLVRLLLEANAQVDARDDSGNTALLYAVKNKSLEIVRLLLARGADVNAVDADDWSVLDVARASGDMAIHGLLLQAGARPRLAKLEERNRTARILKTHAGQSSSDKLLIDAITQSNHALLAHLLKSPVDLSIQDSAGRTPLSLAVQSGDVFATKLLLAHGASVYATDKRGLTPLHYAIDTGSAELLETLLRSGKVEVARSWNENPLLYAINSGHDALGVKLLQFGFSPDTPNAKGPSAVVAAARHNAVAVLRVLATAGFALDRYKDNNGRGLFWHAVDAGQTSAAFFLRQNGAVPPLSGPASAELLISAARRADRELLKLVVEAGADVNARSDSGTTALMTAAATGCLDCIAYLVERGANVNDRDNTGNTALHIAALNRKREAVKKLTASGADPYIVNNAGESYTSITGR